jgi:hypothetical protein
MRIRFVLALIAAAIVTAGCRSSCGSCAPSACEPCCVLSDPVYSGGCGGDPGIGRDGTGAFGR